MGIAIRNAILACAVTLVLAATSFPVAALSAKDILGQWCGERSNPNWTNVEFTETRLIVTRLPGKSVKSFKIRSYDYSDDLVTVHYTAGDDEGGGTPGNSRQFRVEYGHFSSDGTSMNQEPNEAGGRYRFNRCGS